MRIYCLKPFGMPFSRIRRRRMRVKSIGAVLFREYFFLHDEKLFESDIGFSLLDYSSSEEATLFLILVAWLSIGQGP
jgi:hypothetical protein